MSNEEICKLYLNPDKGNNYISKDKIKDEIKELEDAWQRHQEENGYDDENYMYYMAQIKVLNKLLEEK